MKSNDYIKKLHKDHLKDVLSATIITSLMIVLTYFTVRTGFKWSLLLFSIIYFKFVFDSTITHIDRVRFIKKLKS
jgi:hypothetical protein